MKLFKTNVARNPETGFPILNKETRTLNLKLLRVAAALLPWRKHG